jgi:hypothetical protein
LAEEEAAVLLRTSPASAVPIIDADCEEARTDGGCSRAHTCESVHRAASAHIREQGEYAVKLGDPVLQEGCRIQIADRFGMSQPGQKTLSRL